MVTYDVPLTAHAEVNRRFAAVLAMAVSSSAVKLAHHGVMVPRRPR